MSEVHWQPGMKLEDVEKLVILKAYRFYQHNKTQTSIALGISIRTLDNKLALYEGKTQPNGETDVVQTEARIPVEPIAKVSKKQSMSVRQRQEV